MYIKYKNEDVHFQNKTATKQKHNKTILIFTTVFGQNENTTRRNKFRTNQNKSKQIKTKPNCCDFILVLLCCGVVLF